MITAATKAPATEIPAIAPLPNVFPLSGAFVGGAVGLPAEETRDPVAVLVGTMTVTRAPDAETVCTVPPNLLSVQ